MVVTTDSSSIFVQTRACPVEGLTCAHLLGCGHRGASGLVHAQCLQPKARKKIRSCSPGAQEQGTKPEVSLAFGYIPKLSKGSEPDRKQRQTIQASG